MPPARQHLEAENLARGRGLRLKIQLQFIFLHGQSDILLERVPFTGLPVYRGLKETDRSPLLGFGTIEGGFRVRDQGVDVGAVLRIDSHRS
jgi:hypothetical protein